MRGQEEDRNMKERHEREEILSLTSENERCCFARHDDDQEIERRKWGWDSAFISGPETNRLRFNCLVVVMSSLCCSLWVGYALDLEKKTRRWESWDARDKTRSTTSYCVQLDYNFLSNSTLLVIRFSLSLCHFLCHDRETSCRLFSWNERQTLLRDHL